MIDFPASPTTGQIFTAAGASWRYDGTKWVAYGSGSGNAGRNLIHNPLFNIAQRAGPWTATGYTLDRWQITSATDAINVSQQSLADADRAAIGDEAATSALANTFTGNAAAGALNLLAQYVEGARRLGGKTITVSFWAKAASGTPKLGINALQGFGSGGSPSAGVYALSTGMSVTLTTAYARYSVTFAIPSVSGKVFGTNGGDYTGIFIWYSSGSTNNAVAGNIGVQSGTIHLWGVQLEIGSLATPLEKPDPADDLARCQRFYWTSTTITQGYNAAGQNIYVPLPFPVTMRATPTMASSGIGYTNAAALSPGGSSPSWAQVALTITAAGYGYATYTVTASADL
jgi:hypothetical protein